MLVPGKSYLFFSLSFVLLAIIALPHEVYARGNSDKPCDFTENLTTSYVNISYDRLQYLLDNIQDKDDDDIIEVCLNKVNVLPSNNLKQIVISPERQSLPIKLTASVAGEANFYAYGFSSGEGETIVDNESTRPGLLVKNSAKTTKILGINFLISNFSADNEYRSAGLAFVNSSAILTNTNLNIYYGKATGLFVTGNKVSGRDVDIYTLNMKLSSEYDVGVDVANGYIRNMIGVSYGGVKETSVAIRAYDSRIDEINTFTTNLTQSSGYSSARAINVYDSIVEDIVNLNINRCNVRSNNSSFVSGLLSFKNSTISSLRDSSISTGVDLDNGRDCNSPLSGEHIRTTGIYFDNSTITGKISNVDFNNHRGVAIHIHSERPEECEGLTNIECASHYPYLDIGYDINTMEDLSFTTYSDESYAIVLESAAVNTIRSIGVETAGPNITGNVGSIRSAVLLLSSFTDQVLDLNIEAASVVIDPNQSYDGYGLIHLKNSAIRTLGGNSNIHINDIEWGYNPELRHTFAIQAEDNSFIKNIIGGSNGFNIISGKNAGSIYLNESTLESALNINFTTGTSDYLDPSFTSPGIVLDSCSLLYSLESSDITGEGSGVTIVESTLGYLRNSSVTSTTPGINAVSIISRGENFSCHSTNYRAYNYLFPYGLGVTHNGISRAENSEVLAVQAQNAIQASVNGYNVISLTNDLAVRRNYVLEEDNMNWGAVP